MIRIDFIGVPGCGKTTLVNQAIKVSKSDNVIKLSKARKIILRERFSNSISVALNKKISSFILTSTFGRYIFREDKSKLKKFLWVKVSKYERILNAILTNISQNQSQSSSYLKIKRLGWFIRLLEDTILLGEFKRNCVILCDESITSKLFQMDFGLNIDEVSKEKFSELFPDAIVCVRCDEFDLMDRLNSRRKITVAHSRRLSDITADQIAASQSHVLTVAEKMTDEGVPTLMVNSSDSIEVCLEAISRFIKDIQIHE